MTRHPVVHYMAVPDGAVFAERLVTYLNQRRMRGRLNESNEIAIVWELAELDQLDAFLRELARTQSDESQSPK